MYKRLISRIFLGSVLIAVFISCAKISSPSGGPRDRKPPVVVKSTPPNATRNFRGDKFEVTFNEYVVLDNINDKFMVSPPMKKKPRVFTRGKSVVVEFDDKLRDSTTYTFYFLDGIKDLNEGNVLQNFQFVFSTGPVIDSLSVTGNVYNADNLEVPEKTQVIMYRELADSAVKKHLPEYISRVDAGSYFRIDNVRPGIYRLYGLKEEDNSKNYNLPDESFAFMDSTITIDSKKNYIPPPVIVDTIPVKKVAIKKAGTVKDTTTVKKKKIVEPVALSGEYKLYLFTAKRKAHYLISSHREQKYEMTYILSLPPDSMNFKFSIPGVDSNQFFIEPSRNKDTLKVWLVDSSLYSRTAISTIVKYPFTDSLGTVNYKEDTVMMRFTTPRVSKNAKIKKKALVLENNIAGGFLKPGQTIVFKSKTPFKSPDTTHIRLYEILQTNKKSIPYRLIKDTLTSTKYYLKSNLEQKKKYLFVADSAAFRNIYKESSDSIGIKFSIKEPESYCKLTMDVKNYSGDRIIQLLDKSEKLVSEIHQKKDGKVVFPLLEIGIYRLRVIYDLNGDGKWTTGNFDTGRQPEPVSYYPNEIELKSGWELEFVNDKAWDIGKRNFKDSKLLEKKKTR